MFLQCHGFHEISYFHQKFEKIMNFDISAFLHEFRGKLTFSQKESPWRPGPPKMYSIPLVLTTSAAVRRTGAKS